jgi:hypothetical protein
MSKQKAAVRKDFQKDRGTVRHIIKIFISADLHIFQSYALESITTLVLGRTRGRSAPMSVAPYKTSARIAPLADDEL